MRCFSNKYLPISFHPALPQAERLKGRIPRFYEMTLGRAILPDLQDVSHISPGPKCLSAGGVRSYARVQLRKVVPLFVEFFPI